MDAAGPVVIESLSAEHAVRHRTALSALLKDAVDGGASVGADGALDPRAFYDRPLTEGGNRDSG